MTKLVSACLSILEASETKERMELEAWRRERINEALRKTNKFSKEDAPFLATVVACYSGDTLFQWYVIHECP
jgi:hypothetical protein